MMLSFHPCYEARTNRLCAGRDPDSNDLTAIQRAAAVILPQGCREALYRMASNHCRHVFPNYAARFNYPGKTGQARLFASVGVAHPRTWIFDDLDRFRHCRETIAPIGFPLVFKLDWGGEGETVMLLESTADLEQALDRAADYERSGQRGFILQEMIPHANRTLRVVVIGQTLKTYWRIQDDPEIFGTSLNKGARIDHGVHPAVHRQTQSITRQFCRQTKINLAGLDFIFRESDLATNTPAPLLLEINYFFGRAGLGGSTPFYDLLQVEIDNWLTGLGLAIDPRP